MNKRVRLTGPQYVGRTGTLLALFYGLNGFHAAVTLDAVSKRDPQAGKTVLVHVDDVVVTT